MKRSDLLIQYQLRLDRLLVNVLVKIYHELFIHLIKMLRCLGPWGLGFQSF